MNLQTSPEGATLLWKHYQHYWWRWERISWAQLQCSTSSLCSDHSAHRPLIPATPTSWPAHTRNQSNMQTSKKRKEPMTNEKKSIFTQALKAQGNTTLRSEWSSASCITPRCPLPPGWWTPGGPGSPGSGSSLCWWTCESELPHRSRSSAPTSAPAAGENRQSVPGEPVSKPLSPRRTSQ